MTDRLEFTAPRRPGRLVEKLVLRRYPEQRTAARGLFLAGRPGEPGP
jgi:hypothetical protein